ncbi:MAG TPA: hypothetical protein ENJ35_08710, partial [Gammaproteobacteria bacterium]|nr:hypothetical protein [Gammaproteobacteria bacterium]
AHASMAELNGDHVRNNNQLKLEASIHWSLLDKVDNHSRLGLRLSYQQFKRNLRGFTLGQGGYFSPQQHLALSIPFSLGRRNGNLHWGLTASLGIQYFEEDDTPLYPLDNDLQQQIETLSPDSAQLEGQSKSSFTAGLKAGFKYKLNNDFSVGGLLSSSHDNDYHETRGTLFLQYFFDHPGRLSLKPNWLESGPFEQLW